MIQTEKTIIDGLPVTTVQLPAMRGFQLMAKLGKLISPVMGSLSGVKMDADISTIGPALSKLFEALNEIDAQGLALDILCNTSVVVDNGARMISLGSVDAINTVFTGRLRTMIQVMAFSLKANFSDFFGDAGRLSAAVVPPTANS